MPIEIFELVVKATVNESSESSTASADDSSASRKSISNEKLIAEKVLELMKRKKER